MKQPTARRPRLWRTSLTIILVGAGALAVGLNRSKLSESWAALRAADSSFVLLALLLMGLSFFIAAGIYWLLALKPLRYQQLVVIELAAAFANRLLPAGLGGLSLHGVYLYRKKHSVAQATAVVSVNNLLGITAHLLLLAVLVCVRPEVLEQFADRTSSFRWWYAAVVGMVALILLLLPGLRRKLQAFAKNLLASFRLLRPLHVLGAVLLALMLTTAYTLILFNSGWAIGLHFDLLQIFVIFSLGMLAGTATPTPGGLVGAEAGLFGGFVAYGATVPAAGAAVVLYRLVTYWLPLVPGATAFLFARKKEVI